MELHVVNHPLVEHKLTVLRDRNTPSNIFRELVSELVTLEAYEATRNLDLVDTPIETPVAPMIGKKIAAPKPMVVPVLRAGLGMLDGMTRLLPTAEVGFLGMRRDEATLDIITYANRLPEDLTGRQCFLLDPMLATGGSAAAAISLVKARGAQKVSLVCLIAAPEGIKRVHEVHPEADIFIASLDSHLNDHGYIVPGLGDAGDRLFGTK